MASINTDNSYQQYNNQDFNNNCLGNDIVRPKYFFSNTNQDMIINGKSIIDESSAVRSFAGENREDFSASLEDRQIREVMSEFDLLITQSRLSHHPDTLSNQDEIERMSWSQWLIDGEFNDDLFQSFHLLFCTQQNSLTPEIIEKVRSMECLQMNGKFNVRLFQKMCIKYTEEKGYIVRGDASQKVQEQSSFSEIPQSDESWPEWIINGEFNQKFYAHVHMICIVKNVPVTQRILQEIIYIYRTIDGQFDDTTFYTNAVIFVTSARKKFEETDIHGNKEDKTLWPELHINNEYSPQLYDHILIFFSILVCPCFRKNIFNLRNMVMFNYQGKFNLDLFCRCAVYCQEHKDQIKSNHHFIYCVKECFIEYLGLSYLQNERDASFLPENRDNETFRSEATAQIPEEDDKTWVEWKYCGQFQQKFYKYVKMWCSVRKITLTRVYIRKIRAAPFFLVNGQFHLNEFYRIVDMHCEYYLKNGNSSALNGEIYDVTMLGDEQIREILSEFDLLLNQSRLYGHSRVLCKEEEERIMLWPQWFIDGEFNNDLFQNFHLLFYSQQTSLTSDIVEKVLAMKCLQINGKFHVLFFQDMCRKYIYEQAHNRYETLQENVHESASYVPQNHKEWPEWEIDGKFNQRFYEHVQMACTVGNKPVTKNYIQGVRKIFRTSDGRFDLDRFCKTAVTMVKNSSGSEDVNMENWPELHINNVYDEELCDHFLKLLSVLKKDFTRKNVHNLRSMSIFKLLGEFDVDLFYQFSRACQKNEHRVQSSDDFVHFMEEFFIEEVIRLQALQESEYHILQSYQEWKKSGKLSARFYSDMRNRYIHIKKRNRHETISETLQESASCAPKSDKKWPEWKIDGEFNQRFYDHVHLCCDKAKLSVTQEQVRHILNIPSLVFGGKFDLDGFCKIAQEKENFTFPHDHDDESNDITSWPELYINDQYNIQLFENAHKLCAILHLDFTRHTIQTFRSVCVLNSQDKFNMDVFEKWVISCEDHVNTIHSLRDACELLDELLH